MFYLYTKHVFRAVGVQEKNLVFCPSVSAFPLGLPLSEDVEGPSTLDNVDFVIGARPIETGTDSNFVGLLTGIVMMPQRAPSGFSGCVLHCLESITADTAGTDIIASPFDQEHRQLILYGPASPEIFEGVLQTVTYTNMAPDINVERIDVEVHDGISSTTETITIVQGLMRRKRDVETVAEEPVPQHLHHRNILSIEEQSDEREDSSSSISTYWPLAVVALSSTGILIAILVVWGVKPKQMPKTLA